MATDRFSHPDGDRQKNNPSEVGFQFLFGGAAASEAGDVPGLPLAEGQQAFKTPFGTIKISVTGIEEIAGLLRQIFGDSQIVSVSQLAQFVASMPGFSESISKFPHMQALFDHILERAEQDDAEQQGGRSALNFTQLSFAKLSREHFEN